MALLEYLGPGLSGNKLPPVRTSTRRYLGTRSLPNLLLNIHPNCADKHLWAQDGLRSLNPVLRIKNM